MAHIKQCRKYLIVAHRILCSIGLVVHLWFISASYFRYEITASTQIQFSKTIISPAVSICFRYVDILDPEFVAKKLGDETDTVGEHLEKIEQDITLDELFKHTPSGEELLTGALMRSVTNYTVQALNKKQALEVFKISRYQTLTWMCYRFQPQSKSEFNYRLLASASSYVGMIYSIFLRLDKKYLNHTILMMPMVHSNNEYPTVAFLYAPHDGISNDDRKVNLWRLNSYKLENHYLKYPYETDCHDYSGRDDGLDQPQLISDCRVKVTIERLKMIPFSEFKIEHKFEFNASMKITDPITRFDNETIGHEFLKIQLECNRLYRKPDCEQYVHMTHIESREYWPHKNWHFSVQRPVNPTIITEYQPLQDVYTFSLLVLSCFGVWLGLSLIDLNLVDLYGKVEQLLRRQTMATRINLFDQSTK